MIVNRLSLLLSHLNKSPCSSWYLNRHETNQRKEIHMVTFLENHEKYCRIRKDKLRYYKRSIQSGNGNEYLLEMIEKEFPGECFHIHIFLNLRNMIRKIFHR